MLYRGKNSTFVWNLIFANNSPGSEDGKPKHDVADWLVLLLVGPTTGWSTGWEPTELCFPLRHYCLSVSDHYQTIPDPPYYTLLPPPSLFHDLTRCSVSISLGY